MFCIRCRYLDSDCFDAPSHKPRFIVNSKMKVRACCVVQYKNDLLKMGEGG